jgi:hypothetical protein
MLEAQKQFRRMVSHLHLPVLCATLAREISADNASEECYHQDVA